LSLLNKSFSNSWLARMADTREPTLRVTMLPRDTNAHGTIFGGVILSHIDLAGGVAASRQAPRNFVTRAMREVEFIAPVYVGDVVSFYTSIQRQGKTSLTVRVEVDAERLDKPRHTVRVTAAEVVYVAVDEAGKPLSIG
jgi:acyl-CoA thioesterase YciA